MSEEVVYGFSNIKWHEIKIGDIMSYLNNHNLRKYILITNITGETLDSVILHYREARYSNSNNRWIWTKTIKTIQRGSEMELPFKFNNNLRNESALTDITALKKAEEAEAQMKKEEEAARIAAEEAEVQRIAEAQRKEEEEAARRVAKEVEARRLERDTQMAKYAKMMKEQERLEALAKVKDERLAEEIKKKKDLLKLRNQMQGYSRDHPELDPEKIKAVFEDDINEAAEKVVIKGYNEDIIKRKFIEILYSETFETPTGGGHNKTKRKSRRRSKKRSKKKLKKRSKKSLKK